LKHKKNGLKGSKKRAAKSGKYMGRLEERKLTKNYLMAEGTRTPGLLRKV